MPAANLKPEGIVRRVEHRGSVYRLRKRLEAQPKTADVLEFVVEGPRGTGKSSGIAYMLWKLARKYAGARILVIRTERTLLTDTFCKTFEEDVAAGDECVTPIDRGNRHEYFFPSNKSRIVLGGLDKATRYYGSDWDIVVCEEAVQFRWSEIEPFLGSLRNNKMGFHAMIYATNPDAPGNWVNRRAESGLAERLRCFHKDNPSLWSTVTNDWEPKGRAFMATLERYQGVQHERHVLGLWRGAEGAVWANYDPSLHLFTGDPGPIVEKRISIDWGFRDTGVMIVWGIDNCKRLKALAWEYRTQRNIEWWAQRCVDFVKEFNVSRIIGDPSRPDAIHLFNRWLVKNALREICFPADNKRASTPGGDLAGLDLVRWGLDKDEGGTPRIMFAKDGLRGGRDPDLVADNKPSIGYDEIPEYVYAKDSHDEIIGDRTDSACRDDFCDAVRYACSDNWPRTPQEKAPPPIVYPIGSYAERMGTPESRLAEKLRRERNGY